MMNSKLTLKLDQQVIEKAKRYAADKKLSLSRLIENYLSSVTSGNSGGKDIEISPFVKSLSTSVKLPADYDYKKDRNEHLEKKYL